MEDCLLNLARDAANSKFHPLQNAAMDALAPLKNQDCCTREPAHSLRTKCFHVFKLAFESKRGGLIDSAINGIYKMLKDDRFRSDFEPADDSVWFTSQLLYSFASISAQADDTQVDMLKVLLYVACSTQCIVNGRIIIHVLTTCSEVYVNGTSVVRSAAQAATSQILRGFCRFLEGECVEANARQSISSGVLHFNEAIPILQFICSKVDETQKGDRCCRSIIFFLECLHTLISNLPSEIRVNRHFVTFLWQKLCPTLITFLGCPRVDKNIVSREDRQSSENGETVGRGSAGLATPLGFDTYRAKTIYSIGNQLVRLMGCVGSFRPVLESIYYRMLIYPSPEHRSEALKALKEIFGSVSRIVDFAGPIFIEEDKRAHYQPDDMALTRLVMDSIEESCRCGQADLLFVCALCVCSLSSTLAELSNGKGLNEEYVEKVNSVFPLLRDADYSGPSTYDSSIRLPNVYREILRYKMPVECERASSSGHSSGDTEGPEEGCDINSDVEECGGDVERKNREAEIERLNKVRRSSSTDAKSIVDSRAVSAPCDMERENCRQFTKALVAFLPTILHLGCGSRIDEALQEFSSKYCQSFLDASSFSTPSVVMNADGIYLATYAAIKLNARLLKKGYYEYAADATVPVTEEEFIEEVRDSGVLVYLSAGWLSELYQEVLANNFLQLAGYRIDENNRQFLPFVNLLADLDDDLSDGNHMLSSYRCSQKELDKKERSPHVLAGRKISRRILTCCWDTIMEVLATVLRSSSAFRFKLSSGKRNDLLLKNSFLASLECLKILAKLTNVLGLQYRCGAVFSLIVDAACPRFPDQAATAAITALPLFSFFGGNRKLLATRALSMEMILNCGLELGSHAPECWKHIFRCAAYVLQLEQKLFRVSGETSSSKKYATGRKTTTVATNDEVASNRIPKIITESHSSEEDEIMDVYNFLATCGAYATSSDVERSVTDVIREGEADRPIAGFLPNEISSNVVCLLSHSVDRLFDDAASKLNLSALSSFVQELCVASRYQLFSSPFSATPATTIPSKLPPSSYGTIWSKLRKPKKGGGWSCADSDDSLFLSRINQIFLNCVKSARPLVHIMKIWRLIGAHYVEAACCKAQNVAKTSINCVHDAILALLNERVELQHFHFNEALFKPFEKLLCLELCDSDIQDQIVSCICEFVEGNRGDICSGWRSLFGSLRVVGALHAASLTNVFKLFLATDNTLVFSYAAVDFIACLLRHVRGADEDGEDAEKGLQLSAAALEYLRRCCGVLASMYSMPACPVFHAVRNLRVGVSKLEPSVAKWEIDHFGAENDDDDDDDDGRCNHALNTPSAVGDEGPSLSLLDKPNGVLRVWAFLIENLCISCTVARTKYQSQALDVLFTILAELPSAPPGIKFAVWCMNNAIFASVQHWLRKMPTNAAAVSNASEPTTIANFKQCCGTLTDVVVSYVQHLSEISDVDEATFALKQSTSLFVELIVHPLEGIARLGCSCLRHVILSCGCMLNQRQWTIICGALRETSALSLRPLTQLMVAFFPCSPSFYGDLARVKVAARRDSSAEENRKLKHLSQQIFLLENQCDEFKQSDKETDEERSYVLLLYAGNEPAEQQKIIRVPYRHIVVGLLANQLILQTIATVLIHGSTRIVPSLANVLLQISVSLPKKREGVAEENRNEAAANGLRPFVKVEHVRILLSCLDETCEKAMQFDSRPGLKFLLQKVAGLERAANLYKQAGACRLLKLVALFELYLFETRAKPSNTTALDVVKYSMENFDIKYGGDTGEKFFFGKVVADEREARVAYLYALRHTFDILCRKYVDVIVDKDGVYSATDSFCDQPIFFLISQAEEFSDFSRPPKNEGIRTQEAEEKEEEQQQCRRQDNDGVEAVPTDTNIRDSEKPGNSKAFTFSDFLSLTREDEVASSSEAGTDYGRGEDKIESIYTMTGCEGVNCVVEEYAKRKKSCAMLPSSECFSKRQTGSGPSFLATIPEPLPPEIEQQRKTSIHKDSESHLAVWAEVLISVFDILAQLDDETFRSLLPVFFNGVRILTAHATHPLLKHALAEFFHRVAMVYGFSP